MYRIMKCNFILLGIMLMSLFSCGDGDNNDDKMRVTAGSSTTVYIEGSIDSRNPMIGSEVSQDKTYISMRRFDVPWGPTIVEVEIVVAGTTPGTYSITGGESASTHVLYMDRGQYYESVADIGTVTLTKVGDGGKPIIGSFEAVLELLSNPSETLPFSGSFRATREIPVQGS